LEQYGIKPYGDHWLDPWGAGFDLGMVFDGSSVQSEWKPFSLYSDGNLDSEGHAARVRYIMGDETILRDPICIDCECHNGAIIVTPVIIDGWHRLFAHWALKKCFIRAHFGGRVDLLEFLTGAIEIPPC
jgi:hypothetical protein